MDAHPSSTHIQLGQPAIAEYLTLEGAAPAGKICHEFNPSGLSVLHLAASFNHLELLRILLERHPSQYLHLTDPIHPFHLAIVYQATECVSLMISHIGKGRSSSKAHQLSMRLTILTKGTSTSAASHQYAKGYAYHLANLRVGVVDASFNLKILRGSETPIMLATVVKNLKIARLLLEAGSLVNEGDLIHNTPLHHAALLGDGAMVELLLELGANPQVRDDYLMTPAMFAAASGHLQALQALPKGGADLQILDYNRCNTRHHALFGSRTEASLYLMATMNGYDLAQETIIGESVLEEAFRLCEHNMQTLLLNIAPSPGAYCPDRNNKLTGAVGNPRMTTAVMRMLLRRVPQEVLPTL